MLSDREVLLAKLLLPPGTPLSVGEKEEERWGL